MRAFNLIPADERGGVSAGAGKSGGGAFVVLGLLGVLAIFALLYGQARNQISSQRTQVATLTIQAQQAQAQAARLAPYTSFMTMSEQRKQAVSQLVDARFDWAHAFHELGRVLPGDASISSLSGIIGSTSTSSAPAAATPATPAAASTGSSSTPGASAAASTAVTSATPPGSVPTFTLSGCATSQNEVALTLDRLRLIDGVSEVTLQSSTKTSRSSGGGGGGAEGCAGGDTAFAMQISFEPLPSAAATGSASSGSASTTSTTSATVTKAQAAPSTGGVR